MVILINRQPNKEHFMYQLMINRHEDDGTVTEAKKIGPRLPTLEHALRQVDRVQKHYSGQGYTIRRSGGGRLSALRPAGGVITAQLVRLGR